MTVVAMADQGSSDSAVDQNQVEESAGESQPTMTPSKAEPEFSSPDLVPSRRSSRKKQSTFSSDFEYYTPTGRKKDIKEEDLRPSLTPRGQPSKAVAKGKPGQQKQEESVSEEVEEDEERTPMKRKVAVRKQKAGSATSAASKEKGETTKSKLVKGKLKVAARRGQTNKEKKVTGKVQAGRKRKRKEEEETEENEGDESSDDEEDSTPISQLKAQIKESKSQEKRTMTAASVLQSLVKKVAEVSPGSSTSPSQSPVTGHKRKLDTADQEEKDHVPAKKLQSQKLAQKDKLVPSHTGQVKKLPTDDLGLVKRSPSEIAAKTVSALKVTQSQGAVSGSGKGGDHKQGESRSEQIESRKLSAGEEKKGSKISVLTMDKVSSVPSHQASGKMVEPQKSPQKNSQVDPKTKKQVSVVHAIKKADGTLVKRKVELVKGEEGRSVEGVRKIEAEHTKVGGKLARAADRKLKSAALKAKLAAGSGKSQVLEKSGKVPEVKKSGVVTGAGDRPGIVATMKKKVDKTGHIVTKKGDKSDVESHRLDELLKRGIVPKKKRHQPFGNKKTPAKPVDKHGKGETTNKQELGRRKSMEGQSDRKVAKDGEKKIAGGERRKSSDTSKPGRHRSQSGEGSGGERRKSSEGGKKVIKSKTEQEEDGPPALLPVSAATKLKPKHHKLEHEPPLDMTMMDLFKPDGLIVHDQLKKEEPGHPDKPAGPDTDTQQHSSEHDASTCIKPDHVQHVHHVLLEHQYSKPSSPVGVREEGETRGDKGPAGLPSTSDDIESVSHKHTLVDVTLPDQILEESEEPVVEEVTSDLEHTWPDNMDQLEQMVNREQPGQRSDRSSILESLGSELKESGSEFRIVGQVEVGRPASVHSEEAVEFVTVSSSQPSKPITSKVDRAMDGRKHSLDTGQAGADKTRKDEVHQQEASRKVGQGDKRKHKKRRDEEDGNEKEERKEEAEDSDEHGFEDDENDFDWEPNDSDTVYCICRKPHSNRFMICCDKCEEWFHGSCVGISRAKGKQMEANEEEYICPLCTEKGESTYPETKPGSTTVKKSDSLTSTPKGLQKCIGRKCNKTARSGSVYCSNECIMSHAQDSLKAIREEQMKKKAREKEERHSGASSSSSPSSSARSHSSSSTKHTDTVEVVDRKSGTVLKGSSAPRQKELHRWLEKHPTFEVVQPSRHRSSSHRDKHRDKSSNSDRDKSSNSDRDRKSSIDKDRKSSTDRDRKLSSDKDRKLSLDKERKSSSSRDRKSEKEEKGGHDGSKDGSKKKDGERRASSSSQKTSSSRGEESREDGPNQIRLNVRTALRDSLTARAHEADDIMLSSQEIKSLAVTIEEELFSLFQDTGHKYRTKYRSLLFNIKDHKNKGLFRKILTGKIRPHKLVQMSTEELASRELAKWREQESKQQLEMIEKTEKEAVEESASAKHVRKKTHKGEVEIEEEDLSILGTRIEEKKDVKPTEEEEQATSPEIDTTDQHRAHLFDLNCKVCTGKIIPGPEEQAANAAASKQLKVSKTESSEDHKDEEEEEEVEKEDFAKAEEIVKEALRTIQKTEQEVSLLPKMVPSSPKQEVSSPVDSPKITTPGRESSSSASSTSSIPSRRNVVVRSPDSALQSGLEAKPKFTPTGPMLWKGFVSMLDVAKFFTSAYRVSGTTDHITIPDTIHILGRISPDHMWDYLSKIRQAGSKDLTVIRFIPGSDDEKVAYVHLYSYLNSRGRCGVAGNPNKQIKDFYIVPLASHSKIPRTLLPFDGPGLEENRPHMLIGILVRQRAKQGSDSSDTDSLTGKKSGSQSSSSSKRSLTMVNRDPRLAKLAAKENASKESSESPGQVSSPSDNNKSKSSSVEEYEPEYVPLPGKIHGGSQQPVAEYIPTPTVKKKDEDKEKSGKKSEKDSDSGHSDTVAGDKRHHHHHKDHHLHQHHQHHHRHHENHHHHHEKKEEKNKELEDDSEPYSPSKEAEPYSPGQEAAADEPYDPGDESLMDDDGIPVVSSSTTTVCPTVTGGVSAEESKGREELVEKMARSNDPQEISSLMVTALSTTNSTQEQQKLLVDLTRQVEERKLQLAETARKLGERSVQGHGEGKVSGRSEHKTGTADLTSGSTHGVLSCQLLSPGQVSASDSSSQLLDSALSVRVSTCLTTVTCSSDMTKGQSSLLTSTASAVINLPVSSTSLLSTAATTTSSLIPPTAAALTTSSNSQTGIKFSFSKSLSKTPLSSQTAQLFSAESADSSDAKLKLSMLDEDKLSSQLSTPDSSKSSNVSKAGESQIVSSSQAADMPDALKALMKDMMGDGRSEAHGQMVDRGQEKCLLPGQGGTNQERQLKAEGEAESLKESEDSRSSKIEESGRVEDTAEMGKMERETANEGTKEGGVAAPSIDELLDRLKKGGFQFPIKQPTESVVTTASSSTSSTTSTTPVTASPRLTSDDQVAEVTTSSAMDVDLRVSSLPTASLQPGPAGEVAVVSGEMDHPPTVVGGFDRRQTTSVEDKDERRFYEDRDDRLFTPPFSLPKHPLDPRVFPPLPGEARPYPPSSQPATHPGSLHGPLHPRFPLPMAEPHLPYHPTSRPALTSRHPASKGRAQPPPPGTEYEKPAGVLGITNDFPHMDVDQRSRAHPPLPPQPPPPLPPLPSSSAAGGRFPHLPAADMDLRAGDPYRPIPPPAPAEYRGHHGYSGHGRGAGRPYPRH